MTPLRAEVWGSPISHSKSPDLHLACSRHLGIDGDYTRREVTEATLAKEFTQHSEHLTGMSLTMPLKTGILDLVSDHRGDVSLLGAANTAINTDGHWWLTNTDPLGAAAMLRKLLPDTTRPVVLLGAGATAKAIVLGLAHVGFSGPLRITVRDPSRAADTMRLAATLGLPAEVVELSQSEALGETGLVVSTLPSGTVLPEQAEKALLGLQAPLIDVGYSPWPTPLAAAFTRSGLDTHSGLPMLMFQALAQIRCFLGGDTDTPLSDEAGALGAMAEAVGVDPVWATPTLMGQ